MIRPDNVLDMKEKAPAQLQIQAITVIQPTQSLAQNIRAPATRSGRTLYKPPEFGSEWSEARRPSVLCTDSGIPIAVLAILVWKTTKAYLHGRHLSQCYSNKGRPNTGDHRSPDECSRATVQPCKLERETDSLPCYLEGETKIVDRELIYIALK